MDNNDNQRIKVAEDIATLKADVKNMHDKIDDFKCEAEKNHQEIINKFNQLTCKVNEEITTMQNNIKSNRKLYVRLLIISLAIGSFLWIKESRDWILANIFKI